jgi:single-strand DNA-binding protein
MNKVIITGRLAQDIELKRSTGGKSVLTNSVAVKRDYRNAQGEYDSDFINIVAWGSSAEYLSKYAHKGDRVEVVGRWEVRKWQTQQGENRYSHECIVENVTAFNSQPKQETNTYIPDAYTQPQYEEMKPDQDLPF